MNAISYSVFGYNQQHDSCYEFKAYLRGLHINIRMAEVLYQGWRVFVVTDKNTYESKYGTYLQELYKQRRIDLRVVENEPLCKMMLRRIMPIFEMKGGDHQYERIICRDSDSLLTYRDRQAVEYWMRGTKMAHAITDSVSHSITLMGGMIGFMSGPFTNRLGVTTFDDLLSLSQGIDYNRKGADQQFLNTYVLPKVHDSITEHFVLGHPQTFRGDCHNFIHDIDLSFEIDIPESDLKETNSYGFHIGASGFQTDAVVKWLDQWGHDLQYWDEVEKQYKQVFYWKL